MRPLHTAPPVHTDRSVRKSSSRLVLQVHDSWPPDASSSRRVSSAAAAGAGVPRSAARSCDTLVVLVVLAVALSVIGVVFVHRLVANSSAASDGLQQGDQPFM